MKPKNQTNVGMWAVFHALLAMGLAMTMIPSPLAPIELASSAAPPEQASTATVVNLTINPYAGVNWATYNQYKANFHTHTTNSDGSDAPATVIDQYDSKNYDILSLTDHDYTSWPWTAYGKDPAALGMLAVRGNEYSGTSPYEHHMNAFYNFTYSAASMADGIPHVDGNAGLSHINHPGRYYTPTDWAFYKAWFEKYPSCVGLEVYNQGDRYPNDRQLWDNINQNLMPNKLVWGYSNDDKHTTSHLYHNYQYMLMPSLTEGNLRECQMNGAFYFVYEPSGTGTPNVPRISSIVVDDVAKTITITASGPTATIRWYSHGSTQVATGATFNYGTFTNRNFVRAVLDGANGDTFTQPFGLRTTDNAAPASPSNQEVDWWGRSGTSPSTYTYSGVTQAMSAPNAWFCDSDYATSDEMTTPNSQTELTDAQYVSGTSSDDNRATSANPGTGDEIFTKCSFTITEAAADISSIDFTMEIQSDTASYFSIFAYNFTSAAWKQIGPTTSNIAADTDTTITRSVTVKPADYVSGTKEVRWGCYQMTSAQLVRLDYVGMTINKYTYSAAQDNCVNWTKSADDGAGAGDVAGYKIYRSDSQTGPWDLAHRIAAVPAGSTQYYDAGKGQADSTRWWYLVRAYDASGTEELNTLAVQEPGSAPTAPYAISLAGKSANSWVFISFPSALTGNIQDILNDATAGDGGTTWTIAKWFNPQTPAHPWKTYRAGGSFNDMPTVSNQMGFWLYITANGGDQMLTLSSYAAIPASTAITLYAGWNLVGYPSMTATTGATLPGAVDIMSVYSGSATYTDHAGAAMDPIAISHGNAYFMHATANAPWTVTNP